MNILVDMNLAPELCDLLERHGWKTIHWSAVGDPRATDAELMNLALTQGYVVLTHDLDFGTILALTRATGPSVVPLLRTYQTALEAGALVVVDEARARVRVLPLSP